MKFSLIFTVIFLLSACQPPRQSFEQYAQQQCAQVMCFVETVPVSPEEAYVQAKAIDSLKFRAITWDSAGFSLLQQLETAVENKLDKAFELDSSFHQVHLYRGNRDARLAAASDSLAESARGWYEKGLALKPADATLHYCLGSLYDLQDSVALARRHYGQASGIAASADALEKIDRAQELTVLFLANPGESYIELRRIPTHHYGGIEETYCKIRGNGETEYFDFYLDEYETTRFHHRFSEEYITAILKRLSNIRFLSLRNAHKKSYPAACDFDYVQQHHLPRYEVTVYTPQLSHTVSVYGLLTIYNDQVMRYTISITHIPKRNIPPESHIMNKVDSLAAIWLDTFNTAFLDDQIQARWGEVLYGVAGWKNYVYSHQKKAFIKLKFPSLEARWQTPIDRPVCPAKRGSGKDMLVFSVDSLIYIVNKESGDIGLTLKLNTKSKPFISRDAASLYNGSMRDSLAVLSQYNLLDGRLVRTMQYNLHADCYKLLTGKKLETGMGDDYDFKRQVWRLIDYYESEEVLK